MAIGARWGRRIKEDAACALTLDSIHRIFEGTLAEDLAFPLALHMAGRDLIGYNACQMVCDIAPTLEILWDIRGSNMHCVTALLEDDGSYTAVLSAEPVVGLEEHVCFDLRVIEAEVEQ